MIRDYSLKMRPVMFFGLVVIASLVLAACSSASASTPEATKPAGSATGGYSVQGTNNSKDGQLLVTTDGRTLYTFAIDTPGESKCTDLCAKYWPPYSGSAKASAGPAVADGLGTITRSDGTKQATYNSMPLYTYFGDKNPGDVNGDGLNQWGGIWYKVSLGGTSGASTSSNDVSSDSGY